jgi:hypothetical protein
MREEESRKDGLLRESISREGRRRRMTPIPVGKGRRAG